MKTKVINVFSIDELEESAQKKAYNKWLQAWEYPWWHEAKSSREAFEKWAKELFEEESWDLKGAELREFLFRHLPEESCPWTGYYLDDVFLSSIREFVKSSRDDVDLESILYEAKKRGEEAIEEDEDDSCSFEKYKEYCELNEWTFRENGEIEL